MSDDSSRDPLADVFNVLAAPIAGGIRSVEQFQRGIGELFRAVENLNRTLENLNETATRVNRLVADVEEPIRAMMPQMTRTIQAADEMSKLLEGPVRAVAPNIEQITRTLSSPGFSALPTQLGVFMETIGEVSKRLAPLTQFAESAGGLFGGFRMPGMSGTPRPTAPVTQPTATPAPTPKTSTATTKKAAAKKTTARKTTTKTSAAKKTSAKKTNAKKTNAKKTAAKKTSSR